MCFSCLCEKKHIRRWKYMLHHRAWDLGSMMWTKYKALVIDTRVPELGLNMRTATSKMMTLDNNMHFLKTSSKGLEERTEKTQRTLTWDVFLLPRQPAPLSPQGRTPGARLGRGGRGMLCGPRIIFCFGSWEPWVVGETQMMKSSSTLCLVVFISYTRIYDKENIWLSMWTSASDVGYGDRIWGFEVNQLDPCNQRSLYWTTGANTYISHWRQTPPYRKHISENGDLSLQPPPNWFSTSMIFSKKIREFINLHFFYCLNGLCLFISCVVNSVHKIDEFLVL